MDRDIPEVHPTPVSKHYDAIISVFDDISQEEKNDLIAQIEGTVAKDNISQTSRLMSFKPKHRGTFFPFLTNIAAVFLIAITVLTALLVFRVRHTEMSLETRTFLSAETVILERVVRETNEKLRQKDTEIEEIQEEVEELDRQIAELRGIMEASFQTREQELRRAMDAALESERNRLRSQGLSEEEIDGRIEELGKRMDSEYSQQLEAYKKESEATLKEREEKLLEEKEKAQERLERANGAREVLLTEKEKSEAKFQSEKERLREEASEAERRFMAIAEQREREQLVSDQILGSYAVIIDKIERGAFEEAHEEIIKLRELILDDSLDYLPTIVKRRKIELFVVDVLEDMVHAQLASSREDFRESFKEESEDSLGEARGLLSEIRRLIAQANRAYAEGNLEEAESYYMLALSQIPALEQAFFKLGSIEEREERTELSLHLERGNERLNRRRYNEAVNEYRRGPLSIAGSNDDIVRELLDSLQRSVGNRDRGQQVSDLDSQLDSARNSGRESAFLDTLRLIVYLTEGSPSTDSELEREVAGEPLFDQVAEKILALLERETGEILVAQDFQLLGTVTTIASDRLTIEPLVSVPVERGSELWIKRRTKRGGDISIAQAEVTSVSNGRITARIEEIFSDERPRVMDLAYVRIE